MAGSKATNSDTTSTIDARASASLYSGLQPDQAREFKDENGRLKRLVAELSLDKAILQNVASKKWGGPR